MIVEFSVIPIGASTGLSEYVAECLRIVERSGVKHQLTPMGTILEGERDEVMSVVMQCHDRVMQMSQRVLTDIRIDDRADRLGSMEQKIRSVKMKMGKD